MRNMRQTGKERKGKESVFLPIHAEEHLSGQTLMLDGRCLTRSHLSSSSQRFWMGFEGQGSVLAIQVLLFQLG